MHALVEDLDREFLAGVRAFLAKQLTSDLRDAGRDTIGTYSEIEACRRWHRRLYERGWIAPSWPASFGGSGWTQRQRLVFERECAENDAPVLFASGLRALGPLLIEVGSKAQQERYLPTILSGTELWCQGFSEPGAGSDLAALVLSARRAPDGYILNGAKIWTTGAHLADWMFCLARTANSGRPQEGITFLLLPMSAPGLAITPIRTLDGEEEFCQVFFDNVRVPFSDRVGEENQGWAIAKKLMRFARSNNTTAAHVRRALRHLDRVIKLFDAAPETSLLLRLASARVELESLEALELGVFESTERNHEEKFSLLKPVATELHQRVTELAVDAASYLAISVPNAASRPWQCAAITLKKYLATRAASIYSGTNEVHRNLIAHHILKTSR